jgi:photosystem II stability/assembly factor-like uncharacterized protein
MKNSLTPLFENTATTACLLHSRRPFCIYRLQWVVVILCLAMTGFSCGKEEIELAWEEQIVQVNAPLNAVFFTDENTGHIVGGEYWTKGYYLSTTNGGQTWDVDSLTNKRLFALDFLADGYGLTVGVDGYLFRKNDSQDDWHFQRLPYWDILRGVAFKNKTDGILVGGIGYSDGVIIPIKNNTAIKRDSFENEISAVCYSDDNTAHAVGYGIVLRSTDGGENWTRLPVDGDFFRAVVFPSASIGYAVGSTGTILKTTDGGAKWKKIRDGSKLRVSNVPFRDLYFTDEERGYIVGENGTFWRTINGGDDWVEVKGLPEVDFLGIHVGNGTGWLVSEEGRIFRFWE